jgi:hypothetical protein
VPSVFSEGLSVEEGESLLEAVQLGWCEGDGSGVGRGESKDIGFCFVKENTNGRAKALKGLNERREVFIGDKGESIIKIGVGCTLGAAAIITKLVVGAAGLGP